MTAPAKATKAAAPKAIAPNTKVDESDKSEETSTDRIPNVLNENPILADFCKRYLSYLDDISEYNTAVLAEKDSEWNSAKVLEKVRLMARPTDKNTKPNEELASLLKNWEDLINQVARARKSVLDAGAQELGITLSATTTRDPDVEASLKEKRKIATQLGQQLDMIASMTSDSASKDGVLEFLAKFPLPAIGRDQVRTFGNDGKSTPKYRVTVTVSKDGEELFNGKGFTQTALALSKPVFGYDRGKSLKSDDLRKAWEAAGNTPEKTVQDTVEFEDNGLTYKITKN